MLFNEDDFNKFKNKNEKDIFVNILSDYYIKNYRSAIVSLYALVIYDLYLKLIEMKESGNKKAEIKIQEINDMSNDDEKYSMIEKKIIEFYIENYSDYFKHFRDDIDYLIQLRHKCAHLYLNEDDLFAPNQNQAKMLIESMYENLFIVDAPFIGDLFVLVESEIETYNGKIDYYLSNSEKLRDKFSKKYFCKMTNSSISKTIGTLFKLLFISKDNNAKSNANGIFIFLDSLLFYCSKNRKFQDIDLKNVRKYIKNIDAENLDNLDLNYFIQIGNDYSGMLQLYKENLEVYNKIRQMIECQFILVKKYSNYFTNNELKGIFLESKVSFLKNSSYFEVYDFYVDNKYFAYLDFFKSAFSRIPTFNGYDIADEVSNVFIKKSSKLSNEEIIEILEIYNKNDQCTGRNKNIEFANFIKENYPEVDFGKYSYIFKNKNEN